MDDAEHGEVVLVTVSFFYIVVTLLSPSTHITIPNGSAQGCFSGASF